MKPIDVRNETWDQVMQRVDRDRAAVYAALCRFGPCSTRELALRMVWDVLSVRPRVTELAQLGLAEMTARGSEGGVYMAVHIDQARAAFEQEKNKAPKAEQMLLI